MAQTDILPDEMVESICEFADVNTLKSFMKTNSRMYKLCLLKFEEKGFKEQRFNYIKKKNVNEMEKLFSHMEETNPILLKELLNAPDDEYFDDPDPQTPLMFLYNQLYSYNTNKKVIKDKMKLLIKYGADLNQVYNHLFDDYHSDDDGIIGDLLPELYKYAIDNGYMKKFELTPDRLAFNEGWLKFYKNGLKLGIFNIKKRKQIIKSLQDEQEYIDQEDSDLINDILEMLENM
jgi:hypothetical protein